MDNDNIPPKANNNVDNEISNDNATDDVDDGSNNETNASLISCDSNYNSNDDDAMCFFDNNNNYQKPGFGQSWSLNFIMQCEMKTVRCVNQH